MVLSAATLLPLRRSLRPTLFLPLPQRTLPCLPDPAAPTVWCPGDPSRRSPAVTTGTPQSGEWCQITWEGGERKRLGPVAALSADNGRITEVFMLDGNHVCRGHRTACLLRYLFLCSGCC
ncbi:hypothetical protein SETIT_1G105200v2 [Setaria italica]|uniref:Uncharacterized protein n=1 Tax=Setaria italica TaxID=4555 RepID=A0A368PJX1_SETIT|nr:hypothetical protein SETIT_1G105200v2 [Setaria italica]